VGITGGDQANCAEMLARITFRADFVDPDGDMSCADPRSMASTRDGHTDHPTMILCKPGLLHGGINQAFVGNPDEPVEAVTCDSIRNRVTWRMDTLGSVILHEYT
jgi:hypothetical protein